jgi:hypothetical protein
MSATTLTAQESGKKSTLVTGLGAAFVAAVMTVAMTANNSASPAAAPTQAASTSQCQNLQRTLLISTNTGGGTVRFRASGYLSPPYTLSTTPQVVSFPLMRPVGTEVNEEMTIEGNATDVVMSSPLASGRSVYPAINGTLHVMKNWIPATTCDLRK